MSNNRYLLGTVQAITKKGGVLINVKEFEGASRLVQKSERSIWFALSQVESFSDMVVGTEIEFGIPKWIMEDKGLI